MRIKMRGRYWSAYENDADELPFVEGIFAELKDQGFPIYINEFGSYEVGDENTKEWDYLDGLFEYLLEKFN